MKASEIEVGQEYAFTRSSYSSPRRVRVVEKDAEVKNARGRTLGRGTRVEFIGSGDKILAIVANRYLTATWAQHERAEAEAQIWRQFHEKTRQAEKHEVEKLGLLADEVLEALGSDRRYTESNRGKWTEKTIKVRAAELIGLASEAIENHHRVVAVVQDAAVEAEKATARREAAIEVAATERDEALAELDEKEAA